MTQIRLGLSAPTSDGAGRRPSGSLEWRPTKRRAVADDVVLPAPFTVGLADPAPVIEVDPTGPDWAWRVVERVQGGSESARYLAVPDSPTVLDYADLTAVDPATLEPTAEPEAAWWAALEAVGTGGGGGGTVADATTTTKGVVQLAGDLGGTAAAPTVPALAGKAATTDPRFTDTRTPTDGSVTDAKVATSAAISADKLADGTTGKILTAAERTKLAGVATGATANATDAALRDRTTHTGTQSADTLTDGTTNKAFLATERTKLAGVATGATANATDAQLRDRSTHTGTQAAASIGDSTTVGRAVLTATDAAAARAATGAGTSNLVIGTTATTAKAGDYTPADATTGAKGLVQLANGLGGTATAPTALGLNSQAELTELVRDTMGTALVAGTNVTITPNDAGDTITIAATGGGGGSGIAVQDENGTAITGVTQLDFQGAGVTAAAGTGEVTVTIPGGGAPTLEWVSAGEMRGTIGSPTASITSAYALAMQMDATTLEGVAFQMIIPAAWTTFHFDLYWCSNDANAGAVVWRIQYIYAGAGESVGTGATVGANVTGTAGLEDIVVISRLGTGLIANATEPFFCTIQRMAADAADTKVGDANILGVLLTQAS